MKFAARFTNWLEHRWVNPAYVGWVLLGLALFFFAAATNTLAGWLYVISGVMLALLVIAALLPPRNLNGLVVTRSPIQPVTADVPLAIELQVRNPQRSAKGLFQVIDPLPTRLGAVQVTAIGNLLPGQTYTWRYQISTQRRGIHQWPRTDLRTAAPLGLFWCRRSMEAPATAVIYPQVLPLKRCPLIDTVGLRNGQHWRYNPLAQADTQGVTRSLRPYRWGDPTRLIHWRTSARYGELRVRELETMTASREVVIALDTTARWDETSFEQAVVAAASLYTYALQQGFTAVLWLPALAGQNNLLRERNQVMYALAGVELAPAQNATPLPQQATIWLTSAGTEAGLLPAGSRQIVWGNGSATAASGSGLSTLRVDPNEPLETQLQVNIT
ncbi:DUF58 domain-containing protein [Nodosilinea sp. LEGE 06152]|uniref:DUF58 domain-containing protein n=1 Tax=Nodosilinea sp. LEGE 06152 TaxID=2777966 RepID=UPI00187EB6AD|nr:DUF58 domain-containing protein [Nodosilinea sp. LEGE 06152]MBE9158575.1 DUF58 domain-containing protein [Nodosilinea sp. LEGE 06152]